MRIAFDGTTLREHQTGIGYYTEHLLQHLLQVAPENEFILLSNVDIKTSLPLSEAVRIFEGLRFPIRTIWMQFLAPMVLSTLRADVAHFTNSIAPLVKRTPTVLTLHDMTLSQYPHLHPRRRRFNRQLVNLAARGSDAIITVSQHARADILRLTRVRADRVHVVSEAAAPIFRPLDDRVFLESIRRQYELAERFFLFVGTIEPRKNLSRLIQAFGKLHRSGAVSHQLVCVGPFGWGYREVRELIDSQNLEEVVRLTGYVPFRHLPAIYNLSEVFVFPSLHEGFGLPVIEAMACGVPVITAQDSALAEVSGECAELVDPQAIESIAQALLRLATDAERRRELKELSLARAAHFSWHRAAKETVAVYRKVARRSS